MPEIMQQPRSPEELARIAGKELYGTPVGMLRRAELWRLGNAWGMKFPDGASKDFMLPFFKQLEAEGKNPLNPPGGLDAAVRKREVEHSGDKHGEFYADLRDGAIAIHPVDGKKYRVYGGRYAELVDELPPPIAPAPDEIKPAPISDFEMQLLKTSRAQLKKMCKLRGIAQGRDDTKVTLVARIMAASQGE